MQFLTKAQYRAWKKMSRQNLSQRIKRGTIPTVIRKCEREEVLIPVEDIELHGVNLDSLTV